MPFIFVKDLDNINIEKIFVRKRRTKIFLIIIIGTYHEKK